MTKQQAILAAHNNADWYCTMFDLHELQYARTDVAFLSNDTPPNFHSWMTTLAPQEKKAQRLLIKQNAYRDSFVVKDSFDSLDLAEEGFAEYFSASWIFADSIQEIDTAGWVRIESVKKLLLWEAAWKQGGSPSGRRQFPDSILDHPEISIWGRNMSNGFDAGVIANTSENCVGLSNCFGENAYPAAATVCARVAERELPVVGYERGEDLRAALNSGFNISGKLSVWVRP